MDKLTRARRPLRSQLTRMGKDLTDLLSQDPPDLKAMRAALDILEKTMVEVEELDQKVKDQLVEDNATVEAEDEEFKSIEKYKRAFLILKSDANVKLGEVAGTSISRSTSILSDGKRRKFHLPEVKLKTFGGSLKEWLGWWSQFEKIHLDDELHETDKFQYLSQAMEKGSEAKDLIDSYPQTEGNYLKAVEALKERFGRSDLLLQVYVRELLTLVIANVTSKEKMTLSQLYVKLESHLRSLAELQLTNADPATWLFPLVESSLSSDTLRAWQRSPQSKTDGAILIPKKSRLDLLMDFIKVEVQCDQQISLAESGFQQGTTPVVKSKIKSKPVFSRNSEEFPTAAGLIALQSTGCGFCGKPHQTDRCVKAQGMSIDQKTKLMKEKNLCYQCLRPGHCKRNCRTPVKCVACGGAHYPVVCHKLQRSDKQTGNVELNYGRPPPHKKFRHDNGEKSVDSLPSMKVYQQNSNQCSGNVLLNTLKVNIRDKKGTLHVVRLVGDSGSQRSYVTANSVKLAKCKWVEDEWLQNIIFGGALTPPERCGRHAVTIVGMNGLEMSLELLVKQSITGAIREIPAGVWIEEFEKQGIHFSDLGESSTVADILIGSDYWGAIRTGKMAKLPCGLVAEETFFGWTLSGTVPVQVATSMVTTTLFVGAQEVEKLWRLEAIGISDPVEVKSAAEEEKEAYQHFYEHVARDRDGRYVVALPWKTEKSALPSNHRVAEQRLKSSTYNLNKAGKLNCYHDVISGWEKEGLIRRVNAPLNEGHLIPHRPVFKESTTTPVRPVFDASCKQGRNTSLNECLYKGPNLIELIPTMMLRFGERKVGVCADIRKAFQMIKVRQEDQQFQRILWWENQSCDKVVIYQHQRVVFGITSSPFLLGASIKYHLGNITDKIIAQKLERSFYVDNLVTSLDSFEDYANFRKISTDIMNEAKMELRQWACNIPGNDAKFDISYEDISMPLLGMQWDRENDNLSCVVKKCKYDKITKRCILSAVAQIFDPMGILAPALLTPKILLQELWAGKLGWDEEVPVDAKKRFTKWVNGLEYLRKIRIPRYHQVFGATSKEYHIFVDSSQNGIAAVGFLRTELNGAVLVQFLLGKSRLTPKKKPTIPRSELISCVMGKRIAYTIMKALGIKIDSFVFWCDSSTALAWIKRNGDWGVFVKNRVQEILELTQVKQWNHVPGVLNPADLPSRGCSPRVLLESKWWEGVDWLKGPKTGFPTSTEEVDETAVSVELKRSTTMMTLPLQIEPRFSSYYKNIAVWGWVLRFIQNCRATVVNRKPYLRIDEMRKAEKIILRQIQADSFPVDCKEVGGVQVNKDNDQILRVKSRLTNRNDQKDFIYPVLLPKSHPLVDQLIEGLHRYHCHGGVHFLLSKLREKYWVLQSRRAVKRVLRRCVSCKRHTVKKMEVEPAALPAKRVESGEPFTTTGVDLAGPLFLKNKQKAWIVLYTCAVYRAVYLDIVTSLSTEAFLGSLERFVSVHGRPNTMYSDNGTNFVGASNIFKLVDWPEVERESNAKQMQWVFNPPTAAWWGGFWERLVRSVKDLLKRMLGRSKLSYDEMRTCLAGVAATINNRPLTVVTEDNLDLRPLTPAMFIRSHSCGSLPDLTNAEQLREAYRKMKEHQSRLQQRFRKEYLALLVTRSGRKHQSTIQVGDVVLVGSDNKKRFEWPLGLVTELLPGKDGNVRVVKVKTTMGVFTRPLQRLFPLEIPQWTTTEKAVNASVEEAVDAHQFTRSGRESKKPTRYGQWFHMNNFTQI